MSERDGRMGWTVISNEIAGDYDVFKVRRVIASPPDGDQRFEFHIVDVPDAVQTIALTDDDCVVLVEQFRHGIQQRSLEFPAGVIDDGEAGDEAGLRELKEETGYVAQQHEIIATMSGDPALNSNQVFVVAAYGCRQSGSARPDETERIETHLVPRSEMDQLIASGRIHHANAIAAWYFFTRHEASTDSRP